MSETQPRGRLRIDSIAALILLQSAQRQSTTATSNDAGLNMTAAPEMRDLAHRLLAYEAGAGKASEPMESLTLRVYEKLRQSLNEFIGVAGFQSLVSRALALARPEAPVLARLGLPPMDLYRAWARLRLNSTWIIIKLAMEESFLSPAYSDCFASSLEKP